MLELPDIRKQKGYKQDDMAEALKMPQSTYAYKEKHGSFTEAEKAQISKIFKMDIRSIVWTKTATTAVESDKDRIIRQQAETIIKLEAEVKTLQAMIDKLLISR